MFRFNLEEGPGFPLTDASAGMSFGRFSLFFYWNNRIPDCGTAFRISVKLFRFSFFDSRD